jgi:hypothetical protein
VVIPWKSQKTWAIPSTKSKQATNFDKWIKHPKWWIEIQGGNWWLWQIWNKKDVIPYPKQEKKKLSPFIILFINRTIKQTCKWHDKFINKFPFSKSWKKGGDNELLINNSREKFSIFFLGELFLFLLGNICISN